MSITPKESIVELSRIRSLLPKSVCHSLERLSEKHGGGAKWKEYKKKTIITAYQLTTPILITTSSDSLQNGRLGDFLIIGTGGVDIYVCPKQHFLATYAKHRSGKYRYIKKGTVLARQLKTKLKLGNNNG